VGPIQRANPRRRDRRPGDSSARQSVLSAPVDAEIGEPETGSSGNVPVAVSDGSDRALVGASSRGSSTVNTLPSGPVSVSSTSPP